MGKEHVSLWHKKQGKGTGVSSLARRGTMQGAKPLPGAAKLTPAQMFMKRLATEIKKAV